MKEAHEIAAITIGIEIWFSIPWYDVSAGVGSSAKTVSSIDNGRKMFIFEYFTNYKLKI